MALTVADKLLCDALGDALGVDITTVRRVVIDIEANHVPVVHIEQYGDEKLINVVRALEGVQVERVRGQGEG